MEGVDPGGVSLNSAGRERAVCVTPSAILLTREQERGTHTYWYSTLYWRLFALTVFYVYVRAYV